MLQRFMPVHSLRHGFRRQDRRGLAPLFGKTLGTKIGRIVIRISYNNPPKVSRNDGKKTCKNVENIAWRRRILCIDTLQGGKSLAERRQTAGGFSTLKVEKVELFQLRLLAKRWWIQTWKCMEKVFGRRVRKD